MTVKEISYMPIIASVKGTTLGFTGPNTWLVDLVLVDLVLIDLASGPGSNGPPGSSGPPGSMDLVLVDLVHAGFSPTRNGCCRLQRYEMRELNLDLAVSKS